MAGSAPTLRNSGRPGAAPRLGGASGVTIGGPTAVERNLISGNTGDGLWLDGVDVTVVGNVVGLNAAGTATLGNGGHGISVEPAAGGNQNNAIVNNFIGLFKDTSLVTVVGIFDLLGIVQSGFNDPKWASAQTGNTGYFALALIYWVFCFGMSRYSMYIERKLNTGHKR